MVIVDSTLYGISLYLSIQTMNELHDQGVSEKQLLQSTNKTIEILIRTQRDLYDLIKDLVQDNTTNQELIQNSLNKLTTLEFIQNNSVMIIKEGFQLFRNGFNVSNSYLFNRIYFYICTFSFLLYIHQMFLWFLQYLTLKNRKKYLSYLFILSAIILTQSLGLIYFLQITNIFRFLSSLYIYTWILFIRSLASIYHHAFSDY
jgi:hypothetical protein